MAGGFHIRPTVKLRFMGGVQSAKCRMQSYKLVGAIIDRPPNKLGFMGVDTALSFGSFRPPFSKGGANPTRGALVAARKRRNSLSLESATEGECQPVRDGRGNRTSGGFPFSCARLLRRGRRPRRPVYIRFRFASRRRAAEVAKRREGSE